MTDNAGVEVRTQDVRFIDKLAQLSYDAFRAHAPDWLPTLEAAREEVTESLQPGQRRWALVGVLPDAEGVGKPSIHFAKKVAKVPS